MSKWNPKDEWRKLRLETEAIYLYEQTAKGNFLMVENQWEDKLARARGGDTHLYRDAERRKDAEIAMEQRPKCETWDDLRAVVALMAHGKRVKELAAAGGDIGSGAITIMGLIPAASTIVNWAQAPAKLMKKPKDFASGVTINS